MTLIIEPQLSFKITGLCFKVHNKLGRFASERQYCDELEKLFIETGLSYERECDIKTLVPDSPKGNRVDFLIEKRILLDAKAKKFVTKEDYLQMIRYLEASKLKLGLIVNFRNTYIKPKRVINSKI